MTIESPQLFTDSSEVDESTSNSSDASPTVVEEQRGTLVTDVASEVSKPKKSLSKAARIRKYMVANPSATNIEIVEKLSEYGVKYPDVAGVRGLMKRKEAESNAKAKGAKIATPEINFEIDPEPLQGIPRQVVKTSAKPAKKIAKSSGKSQLSEINLADLETGLSFIEQVNGVENARRIIELVARIRQASID